MIHQLKNYGKEHVTLWNEVIFWILQTNKIPEYKMPSY